MPRSSPLLLFLIVLSTIATPGCGGGGNSVKVSGKLLKGGVKYTPPEGHRILISLIAIDARNAAGRPILDEPFHVILAPDGESFTVPGPEGYGIPPGKYRVSVTQRMTNEAFAANPPQRKPNEPPIERDADTLNDKFGPKTSPIIREIPASTRSLVVDLDRPTEGGPGT